MPSVSQAALWRGALTQTATTSGSSSSGSPSPPSPTASVTTSHGHVRHSRAPLPVSHCPPWACPPSQLRRCYCSTPATAAAAPPSQPSSSSAASSLFPDVEEGLARMTPLAVVEMLDRWGQWLEGHTTLIIIHLSESFMVCSSLACYGIFIIFFFFFGRSAFTVEFTQCATKIDPKTLPASRPASHTFLIHSSSPHPHYTSLEHR